MAIACIKTEAMSIYSASPSPYQFPDDLDAAMAYISSTDKKQAFQNTVSRYHALALDDQDAIIACFNTALDNNSPINDTAYFTLFKPNKTNQSECFLEAFDTDLQAHFEAVVHIDIPQNSPVDSLRGLSIPSPIESPFSPKSAADFEYGEDSLPKFSSVNSNF
jgi:hypothetical protein